MLAKDVLRPGELAEQYKCLKCGSRLVNCNHHLYCVTCQSRAMPTCPVCGKGFVKAGDPLHYYPTITSVLGITSLEGLCVERTVAKCRN